MGIFSSSSRSSSRTEIDETVTADNRLVTADVANVGGNVNVKSGDGDSTINVTTTDYGALDTASKIADKAFSFSSEATSTLTQSVGQSVDKAIGAVKSIADNATKDEAARTQQFIVLGVVVLGGFYLFVRFKKGKK